MKPLPSRKPGSHRLPAMLAAACAAVLVFSASKCATTTFPAYVTELCANNVDDDEDGKVDCKDNECSDSCRIHVEINPIPQPVKVDTFEISGTQANATSILVNIAPIGDAGAATLEAGTWKRVLAGIKTDTTYTVTVIASKGDLRDTATTTFVRKH